ncbi:MAG: FliH/SctL family protein [Roseburia sp.]|nr:FliH/SctL family protein [Roseburia sp.]MCM1241748.1 FliH/SctL family protein [Roseburia sp.]
MWSNRNLYKSRYVVVEQEEKCVIDSNSRLVSRIEEIEADKRRRAAFAAGEEYAEEGFVGGLGAEQIDTEGTDGEAAEGNVIKAQGNPSLQEPDGPTPEELREQAEAELAQAREEVEQIRQIAREEIEREKHETLDEARKTGYDEGYKMAQAEAERMRDELDRQRVRMEEEYDALIEELEPQFIDTITAVYNHIFQVELENERNILVHLIETTLRKVESSRTFIVHVSKDDYAYVNMQKKMLTEEAVSGRGVVEVVEDITLHKNECMIETDGGIFDCGVGTQLEELTKRLKLLSFMKDEG